MYNTGDSVFVKTRVGGSEVAFPATITGSQPAEGQHSRAKFQIMPDGGNGTAWVTSSVLFPRQTTVAAPPL